MNHTFIFTGQGIGQLTETMIARHTSGGIYYDAEAGRGIFPETLEIDRGSFIRHPGIIPFPPVIVVREGEQLLLTCACFSEPGKLCEHQAQVLNMLISRDELGAFFNVTLRRSILKKFAADYGLENEEAPDRFFRMEYQNQKMVIIPLRPSLIAVTRDSLQVMKELINPPAPGDYPAGSRGQSSAINPAGSSSSVRESPLCVVFKQHKHDRHLLIDLYQALRSKDGRIKNPLTPLQPLDLIWTTEDHQAIKFFTAIHKFQGYPGAKRSASDIAALRAILRNPVGADFYYHDSSLSPAITSGSLIPVRTAMLPDEVRITVSRDDDFYELTGHITIGGVQYSLKDLTLKFTYFILAGDAGDGTLYLVDQLPVLGLIDLLKKRQGALTVHVSKYPAFQSELLVMLEDKVPIEYQYIPPANPRQLEEQGFDQAAEKIIYLSDFGSHVMLTPVIRYGEIEIPVRTRRPIHTTDDKGNEFAVSRDEEEEVSFTALLLRQHSYFEEQLENDLSYFYLHKKYFLEEEWFLGAFEEWRLHHIKVLGFNELDGNRLNPYPARVDIKVLSGINWFNAVLHVRFGKTKASLRHLHKAIRNKSRYVTLDDGTLGILPEAWMEKFAAFFNAGDIVNEEPGMAGGERGMAAGESLRIPRIAFSAIEEFYTPDIMDETIREELASYRKLLGAPIQDIPVPPDLRGTLRPYQKQGLNWLNFLDDLSFGGCLADEMGLGKSIQIIAFILSQRTKFEKRAQTMTRDNGLHGHPGIRYNTNLIVVPTTLLFNWKMEVEKFAPSIRIHTIYGSSRLKSTGSFDDYEIILTSYGVLLSDIQFLKEYVFNYIFLDESQNIKNPETQRYKAVRALQSRNKIAITGTPVENNTFDLYSQLSFACPGLLGSKIYFKDIYSAPIDNFKNTKRAGELRERIRPFILRRTKQEVAAELPDKTDMVLYCAMKEEQRRVYAAYEKHLRETIGSMPGDDLKKSSMHVLKGLTRLRQLCDSPALLGDDDLPGFSRRPDTASAKIDMLMEQISDKMKEHKILVFSQFVSMLELIKKELVAREIPHAWLTGGTRNREAAVSGFQNNPAVRVFLISLKAGGTGLNLTAADYVYLVDPWWNPAVEDQAIDRAHRIGQSQKVMAVRLICPGTVEEKIMKLQESKKKLVGELVQTVAGAVPGPGPASFPGFGSGPGGLGGPGGLTKEELLDLLDSTSAPS